MHFAPNETAEYIQVLYNSCTIFITILSTCCTKIFLSNIFPSVFLLLFNPSGCATSPISATAEQRRSLNVLKFLPTQYYITFFYTPRELKFQRFYKLFYFLSYLCSIRFAEALGGALYYTLKKDAVWKPGHVYTYDITIFHYGLDVQVSNSPKWNTGADGEGSVALP